VTSNALPPSIASAEQRPVRRAITVSGIVQGVGFRPFVHRLATDLGLAGFVRNAAAGTLIEIEGDVRAVDRFIRTLGTDHPPHARIDAVHVSRCAPHTDRAFRIETSDAAAAGQVACSPDIATCDDCLRELFDPADRRYRYPFITCAQCGPRLTMIVATPYDRERTTMARFPMCHACRAEYDNPRDRRFHAEPIACPVCGPRLRLLDTRGVTLDTNEPLRAAVRALAAARIVAVKGLGGYHLVCLAADDAAVARLRRRKTRDAKPFAIMVEDLPAAAALCEISATESQTLTSPARPVVLLRRRAGTPVAAAVAPGMALLGVMLPYTPLHHLLLHEMAGQPLVMTSGNRSDEPIAHDDDDAIARLGDVADLVLAHDRAIHLRSDDSVVRVIGEEAVAVRRARGEAPRGLLLPTPLRHSTLALGGHLKAAVAFGDSSTAVPSHHLGDLDDYATYRAYVAAIAHYERLLRIAPRRLVHDMHPDYASTRYARERARATGEELLAVQHHHAHMVSCMAEHGLSGPAIGVCFDGAGWGTDGTIWGGEFLLGDARAVRRAAHLRRVPMPGGEAAIREPWRMAVAHLREAGEDIDGSALARRIDRNRLRVVETMLARGFNTPLTSSVGRLFDAVAAMIGACDRMSFEGQAAMQLESLAMTMPHGRAYPFAVVSHDARLEIDPRPLVAAIAADVRAGAPSATIARRFHTTLVDVIEAACRAIRDASGVDIVVLSGGVFVNAIVAHEACARLTQAGFRAYRHRRMPPNDGGLCLGQLAVAAALDGAA
jgi:hydrogenase maturation protein HypF